MPYEKIVKITVHGNIFALYNFNRAKIYCAIE